MRVWRTNAADSAWDALALVVLPIANAALGFIAFYALLDGPETTGPMPWLAVGFAAFYLLLLRLPAQGRLRASPAVLSALHLTLAVVFLTIAIPLKAQGRWLTIGWLAEGAALLWVASRAAIAAAARAGAALPDAGARRCHGGSGGLGHARLQCALRNLLRGDCGFRVHGWVATRREAGEDSEWSHGRRWRRSRRWR